MAAIGKKNKTKWIQIDANIILETSRKSTNWDDIVAEEYDTGNQFIHDNNASSKIVLPTAPRASRGTAIDESKVPTTGPFQAYLSNIPYDLNEDELVKFFEEFKIKNVRLPREDRSARAKGFGYIEFEDRASLCAALSLGDPMLKGRIIKIELATNADSGRGGNRGRGGRDRDQTSSDRSGNWRSGPRQEEPEDRGGFDRGFGGSSSRRDFGGGSGGFSRGFDREERSFQRDDKSFDRFDRGRDERGRDGGFRDRYDRDRGFGRDRDGFGDRSGGGGFRERGREEERFSRPEERTERGGQWRDEPRDRGASGFGGAGGRFEGRDSRDRDRKYGPPPRRDDMPPPRRDDLPAADRDSRTRQKLVLQPRTKPKEPTDSANSSASIFGGAKPVDTAAREREIEERLMRSEDFTESRSKGGPGSTGSRSEKQFDEKKVEPAPPPKENAWSRKPPPSIVNNGRSSPEDEVPHSTRDFDERSDGSLKDKNTDDAQVRGGGKVLGSSPDKPKGKEVDKTINKPRDRKENVDDLSKMPKVPESKTPNFAGSNKFSTLDDSDEAPTE